MKNSSRMLKDRGRAHVPERCSYGSGPGELARDVRDGDRKADIITTEFNSGQVEEKSFLCLSTIHVPGLALRAVVYCK